VARKEREGAARFMAGLTQCQKQTMDMVLAGCPSKNVAAERGISHRAGVKSLPALARLAIAATG
jgi:two-component system CheB/CheR fusion protein